MSVKSLTPKGARTRAAILSTAAQLVYHRGVAATSLNDVLESSKAGKSQVYHYFESKDEMIQQVLAFRADEFERRLAPLIRNLETWADVESWFALALEEQRSLGFVGGCPFGSMAAEVADREEPLRQALAAFFKRWIGHIAHGLGNLQRFGHLQQAVDLEELAVMVLSLIEGGMLLSKTLKNEGPLRMSLGGAMMLLRRHATPPENVTTGT